MQENFPTQKLLKWYQKNKKMLPWRVDKDPYHVWISEIMLQQTRIEAVKSYYLRFMEKLPTIEDLANVSIDELFKLWEGLGYYNRARNLKKAAMMIMDKYHGEFPRKEEEILSLPGIGEYTLGAIGSICFSLKVVAIDGNVLRVYSRVYLNYDPIDDIKVKRKIEKHLLELLPKESGDFNQALMELGENICLPKGSPKCEICPLANICQAYSKNKMLEVPIKAKKTNKKIEQYTIFIFNVQEEYAIEKRKSKGILGDLWQFPNVEGTLSKIEVEELFDKESVVNIQELFPYQHVFTHRVWQVQVYFVSLKKKIASSYQWINKTMLLNDYAIPSAFKKIVDWIIEN